jgi:desulfoferrodoxin (superoxide reductase-like protein)
VPRGEDGEDIASVGCCTSRVVFVKIVGDRSLMANQFCKLHDVWANIKEIHKVLR